MRLATICEAKNADRDSSDRGKEHSKATLPLDSTAMSWLAASDLFTTGLRLLERGSLSEADRVFGQFLERTKDEPSAGLWPTVMLARGEIYDRFAWSGEPPEPDEVIAELVRQVINTSLPC